MPYNTRISDLSDDNYEEVLRRVEAGERLADIRSELVRESQPQDT